MTTAAADKFDAIIALENRPRKADELAVAMATMDAAERAEFDAYRVVALDAKAADLYARHEAGLRRQIAELNEVLGLADAEHNHQVTFGYIGNLGNGRDDRRWYVFLPHPGRVGTEDDTLGGFATGSLEGLHATRQAVNGAIQGARLARR